MKNRSKGKGRDFQGPRIEKLTTPDVWAAAAAAARAVRRRSFVLLQWGGAPVVAGGAAGAPRYSRAFLRKSRRAIFGILGLRGPLLGFGAIKSVRNGTPVPG